MMLHDYVQACCSNHRYMQVLKMPDIKTKRPRAGERILCLRMIIVEQQNLLEDVHLE